MSRRGWGCVAACLSLAMAGVFGTASRVDARPPTWTSVYPAGICRGQTVLATASGTFDHWPARVWVDRPGLTITPEKEKGKLTVAASADAAVGVYRVRLWDSEGATALRAFVVGTGAEPLEVEPNDDPRAPQVVSALPVTLNGRLAKNGDVDGFAVLLEKGQVLVADVMAQRELGSPMDAVLQVASSSGFVLAQNDDTIERDPRLVFEAPAKGRYLVRLFAFPSKPDSSIRFAGGEGFVYRLTLTISGFVDYPFPLAVPHAGGKVELVGWNVSAGDRWSLVPGTSTDLVSASGEFVEPGAILGAAVTGMARLRRVDGAVVTEAEPNSLDHPQPMRAEPVAVSGRIDPPGDRDVYSFRFKKGDKRVLRVESRRFGLPLDPAVRLLNAAGQVIFDVDDSGRNERDVEREFTAEQDGDYRVVVRDVNDGGGPRFAYLLTVHAPLPDYTLTLETDQFTVTPAKPVTVTLKVERKAAFGGEIQVMATDLPKGVTARPVVSKSGTGSSRTVKLELAAEGSAGSGPFRVVGREVNLQGARGHLASAGGGAEAFATEWPWVTVQPVPPAEPKKPAPAKKK